ncbi:MAG: flagellar basal body rod protein FlgC, partial [Dehalococcoidia bacterium]|nr:flagellar basal body rod protein FlgC [Dehalococcoidia bacterium]
NAETTRTAEGGPYRRQQVLFTPRGASPFASILDRVIGRAPMTGPGVEVVSIVEDARAPRQVVDPTHPDADPVTGVVEMPNVNLATEMVDLMAATRSYQANVTALNAARAMALRALEIGR